MVEIIKDSIPGYYDENLGAYVDSRSKRRKLMKKKGVAFAADYSTLKPQREPISKKHLPTRDQMARMIAELKKQGGRLKR